MNKKNVIYLTKTDYRELAEITKKEASALLEVSTYSRLGAWGRYNPFVMGAYADARYPNSQLSEHSVITIADRVNVDKLKSTNRPEIDWGKIPDKMIYRFIVWHEIGHRVNNFCQFRLWANQEVDREILLPKLRRANEVLADRYAWQQLFPGQPVPIGRGKSEQYLRGINQDIDDLSQALDWKRRSARTLPEGQYKCVSISMLKSKSLAAYIGSEAAIFSH